MNRDFICFTSLPKLSNLLYVYAVINKSEKNKVSNYNSIIIKCRQLLFENEEVIAYPELEDQYGVVIVSNEIFYSEKLLDCIKKYNLRTTGPPSAVTRYIYERSCYYTILTKIAPKWNNISNYFVYGRDFLMNTSPTDCAYVSIRITEEGETTFHFNTHRIKLPTMNLDRLELPNKYVKELLARNITKIEECDQKYVRVLPSLKKGKVLSVSNKLLVNTANYFPAYKYIRRHWKNTYGYRLPEDDSNMLYFEISFFKESPIFTYPSICVRPYDPVFLKRTDPLLVVNTFLDDMMKAVPVILGEKFDRPAYASQPSLSLNNITQKLNRMNTIPYTPENHFIPNKLIPDTQKFVFSRTQNSTQKANTNKDTAISQFVEELQQFAYENEDEQRQPHSTTVEKNKEDQNKNFFGGSSNNFLKITNQISVESTSKSGKQNLYGKVNEQGKYVPIFARNKISKESVASYADFNKNLPPKIKIDDKYMSLDVKLCENIPVTKEKMPQFQQNRIDKSVKENPQENKRKLDEQVKNNNEKKYKITTNITDMEQRYKNNTVEKLTVPVLATWLKEKGVRCTTKDKKCDLVKKVTDLLSKQ